MKKLKLKPVQRDMVLKEMRRRYKLIMKKYPFLENPEYKTLTLDGIEDVLNECTEVENGNT